MSGGGERDEHGRIDYQPAPGDVVVLRRAHPCGSDRMAITAVGLDVRLSCTGCGAQLTLTRDRLRNRLSRVAGTVDHPRAGA